MNDELKALCGLLRSSVTVRFTVPYDCFDKNIDNSNCKPCQRIHDSLEYLKADDSIRTLISSAEKYPNKDVIIIVEKKQTFGDGNE